MIVLFTVENNNGLDSVVDGRFGRAGYFLIYDTGEEKVLFIEENTFKNEAHGVGIKIANYAMNCGCKAAVGAQPGPKAAAILTQAGVKTITVRGGTVKEILQQHKEELTV